MVIVIEYKIDIGVYGVICISYKISKKVEVLKFIV